jgi:hypothetical protein
MRPRSLPVLLLLLCACSGAPAAPPAVMIPAAEPVSTAAEVPTAAPSSSAAALAHQLDQLDTAVLGASRSSAKPEDVGVLRLLPSGGGLLQPGVAGGLSGIGSGSGPGAPGPTAGPGVVKGPVGKATIGPVAVKGTVANGLAVAAGMSAGFRRCYNKGLSQNPAMKGSVVITAKLGPQGEVLSATPLGGAGLDDFVIACMVARVSSGQFAPPDGGSATVTISVKLEDASSSP